VPLVGIDGNKNLLAGKPALYLPTAFGYGSALLWLWMIGYVWCYPSFTGYEVWLR
jgi:hypothetical protein